MKIIIGNIEKSQKQFENKLAKSIKNDSKRFYAHIRSKERVCDEGGPLKHKAGRIQSE